MNKNRKMVNLIYDMREYMVVMNSADSDPAADNALGSDVTPVELDTKSTLEKRFHTAVTDTGQSDAIVAATPKPADSEAAPLGALPPYQPAGCRDEIWCSCLFFGASKPYHQYQWS